MFRAWNFETKQLNAEKSELLDFDKTRLKQQLSTAITYQTISYRRSEEESKEEFSNFVGYVKTTFPLVHQSLQVEVLDERHLVYQWVGKNNSIKPVLFIAHTDVVPVENDRLADWHYPPFSGHIDKEFIWGRGSMDNKSSVISMLASIEKLLEIGFQPERSIFFAFGGDEETGGENGAEIIARQFKDRGLRFEFAVDEGGIISNQIIQGVDQPVALIGIAEKGYLTLDFQINRRGGHASMPPNRSVIGELGQAMSDIENQPLPARLTPAVETMFDYLAPEMPFWQRMVMLNRWLFSPVILNRFSQRPSNNASIRSTTAVTEFNAGVAENVIPKRASASVNFRLLTGDTPDKIKKHIIQVINNPNILISERGGYQAPSIVSDTDSQAFTKLHESVKVVFPDITVAPFLVIAATDSRHYAGLVDNIYRFQPVVYEKSDLARFHGVNERISINALYKMTQFYALLIQKL